MIADITVWDALSIGIGTYLCVMILIWLMTRPDYRG